MASPTTNPDLHRAEDGSDEDDEDERMRRLRGGVRYAAENPWEGKDEAVKAMSARAGFISAAIAAAQARRMDAENPDLPRAEGGSEEDDVVSEDDADDGVHGDGSSVAYGLEITLPVLGDDGEPLHKGQDLELPSVEDLLHRLSLKPGGASIVRRARERAKTASKSDIDRWAKDAARMSVHREQVPGAEGEPSGTSSYA